MTKQTDDTPTQALLTARAVCEHFGGISDMTLWRWLHAKENPFPPPLKINKRRYWRASDVADFESRARGDGR